MATYLYYAMLHSDLLDTNEKLSKVGNILANIGKIFVCILYAIAILPFFIIEHTFMLLFWGVWFLCHKKEYRVSYCKMWLQWIRDED